MTSRLQIRKDAGEIRMRKNAIIEANILGGIALVLSVVDDIWKSIKKRKVAHRVVLIAVMLLLCLITFDLYMMLRKSEYLIISLVVLAGYLKSLDFVKSFVLTATQ